MSGSWVHLQPESLKLASMKSDLLLKILRDRPGFLRRHQAEIARMLRLAERDIVDLTGRQVVTLREENDALRKRLGEWYENAAVNDMIGSALHSLVIRILRSRGRKITRAGLERMFREEFTRGDLEIGAARLFVSKQLDLSAADARKTVDSGIVLSKKPAAAIAGLLKGERFSSYLHIPLIGSRDRLIGMAVVASSNPQAFPSEAYDDYALRLGEVLAAALADAQ